MAGYSWRVWYFAVQWFFAYNAYYGILFFGPLLIGDVLHPGSSEQAAAKRAEPGVLWLATARLHPTIRVLMRAYLSFAALLCLSLKEEMVK